MIARGDIAGDLERFEEILPKFRDELRSTITYDTIRKIMISKYFMHNNSCGFFTNDFFSTGHKMCQLSISIYHY